jgi:hypothetical protein
MRLLATGFEAGAGSILGLSGSAPVSTSNVRNGTYSLNVSNNGDKQFSLTPGDTFFTRVAIYGTGASSYINIDFREGVIVHTRVTYSPSGRSLTVKRDTTVLDSYVNSPIPVSGNYFCLEIKTVIHDTTGEVTLKVNGTQVLSLQNVDTQNGGTGVIDNLYIYGYSNGHYIDDLAINDDSGSINNSWCGDGYGKLLQVNAGGDITQLTPSIGSNYECVDDIPYNTTDFVSSDTLDQYDLYALVASGIAAGEVVNSLTAHAIADLSVAGDVGNGAVGIKSGASTNWSSDVVLAVGTWANLSKLYELNPDDSEAFNAADLDALQVGVKVR